MVKHFTYVFLSLLFAFMSVLF